MGHGGMGDVVAELKMEVGGAECEIDPDDVIDDIIECAGADEGEQVRIQEIWTEKCIVFTAST